MAGSVTLEPVAFPRPIDRDDELRSVVAVRFLELPPRTCVMIDGEGPPEPAVFAIRMPGEGRVAQVLHLGPYATGRATIERLHAAIEAAGLRPRGRHHEIYLGIPGKGAPEKLRTILRQPVE